jgi:EAL domain-containing protein (putative c-di-GMP-specific phosphodiesterase class I)
MDAFGTGCSSMSCLIRLPLAKIYKAFIRYRMKGIPCKADSGSVEGRT